MMVTERSRAGSAGGRGGTHTLGDTQIAPAGEGPRLVARPGKERPTQRRQRKKGRVEKKAEISSLRADRMKT